jgi:iron complex transport system substrate-binding protein
VSRFCDYPPAVSQLPKVGGFFDPNLEAIVALRPDLVVLLTESEQAAAALRELQIPTLLVCHQNLDGLLESFQTLGRACGAEAESRKLLAQIQSRIDRIGRMTAARPRPRVMVVAGRALNVGKLEAVFVAAGDGHLDRLVELAGGVNAFPSGTVRFPTVAQEGILKINPDVIIDLVAERDLAEFGKEKILADWQQVAEVEAVRRGRVCILADDRATRPGPSFVVLLEHFARLIHPEIDWQTNAP